MLQRDVELEADGTDVYPRLPEAVISPNGKLVVLYVQAYESPTVDQLAADLGLSELAVMLVVERLVECDVLRVDDGVVAMTER